MSFDIMSFLMGKAAGGGGGGGGSNIFEWDFTSATPLVDKARGATATSSNVTFGSSGAIFDGTTDYIRPLCALSNNITIEIDVTQMSLGSGNNRRFVNEGASNGNGLNWYYSGVWAFTVGSTTVTSEITDSGFFDGHTVKIFIDTSNKWHIYRDETLVFEPDVALELTQRAFLIGSASNSINNAIITGVRVY